MDKKNIHEMKESGSSLDDILEGKNSEFESLANYCKLERQNFSKITTTYKNSLV